MALTQVSTGGIKDGQVQTADLADGQVTVGKLHADALDRTYTLGASGTNHYTFTGEGLTGAVNDPTLYLTRGKTYRFVNGNSAGAHPFRIQTTVNGSAGTEYNTGVTNNGGAGGSTIVFEVPHDAPDVLYYQCTSHNAMGGILYVTGALADGSVTTAKIAAGAVTNTKIATNAVGTTSIAADAITNALIADNAVESANIADQAVTLAKLPHGTSSNDGKFLRANNGADPTFETVSAGPTIANQADNRVITATGTTDALNAESNVIIDGSGRVGIGTTSPSNLLHVKGSGHDKVLVESTGTAHSVGVQFKHASGDAAEQTWQIQTNGGASTQRDLSVRDATAGSFIATFRKGGGITFNGDTAAANALDDYESGTWTVNTPAGSPSTTYSASYVKIGDQVTVNAYITGPTTSDGNNFQISSLPFTAKGSANYWIGSCYTQVHTTNNVFVQVNPGNNDLYVYERVGNTVSFANLSGYYLLFTVTYFTD